MNQLRAIVLFLFIQAFSFIGRANVCDWENHLSSDWVTNIVVKGDTLYLGTAGGLVIYDVSSGQSRFLDRTNGLTDNYILGMAEHNGTLWVGGSHLGVSAFDGINFKNYSFPFENQSSFAFDDVQEKVYIGAIHDIYILCGDQISTYTPDPVADLHSYPSFNALAIDSDNTLWFGGYIFGYLTPDGRTTLIDCDHSNIRDILINDKGDKWLATNQGLKKYDNEQFTTFSKITGHLPSDDILDLAYDSQKNLWMAAGSAIVKYNGNSFCSYPLPTEYSSDIVYAVAPDGDNVWVGTRLNGLLRFCDGVFNKVVIERNGLATNQMYETSCADNSGNVFFASEHCLSKYSDNNVWNHLFRSETRYIAAVTAASFDRHNRLWVAPNSADTALVTISGLDTTIIHRSDTPFKSYQINKITFDSHNNLWVGTTAGLYRYDGKLWSAYNSDNSPMPGDWVTALAVDLSDRIWISVFNQGLLCFDGQIWTKYDTDNSPLPYNYISSIQIDSHNTIWMNNRRAINIPVLGKDYGGGLIHFDGIHWDIYNQNNSDIGSNCIMDIAIDCDNHLWVAAWDVGLVFFDGTGKWETYNVDNSGIANPWPIQVCIDSKRDRIWLAHEAYGGISSAKLNIYANMNEITSETEYIEAVYTIDGLKVRNPLPGRIYIVRRNNGKVSKYIFRN